MPYSNQNQTNLSLPDAASRTGEHQMSETIERRLRNQRNQGQTTITCYHGATGNSSSNEIRGF